MKDQAGSESKRKRYRNAPPVATFARVGASRAVPAEQPGSGPCGRPAAWGDIWMIDRHIRNLRLDRRLQRRRGWIPAQELEEALTNLPDVAAKGELVTEAEEEAAQAASSSPAPSASAAPPPVGASTPLAGETAATGPAPGADGREPGEGEPREGA